jgi:outer membrane receptor protein involved in Fe transport
MTVAAAGTAVDVLRFIPQVEVDGSNKVSLRGSSNVVVQINGRSTPLRGEQLGNFLAQMPARMVKSVEVAANPSAKDDPEGTAGIINIVLNQEAELGLSGGIDAGTSTSGAVSLSGNVGKQQGQMTAFGALYLFRDNRQTSGSIARENIAIPGPSFVQTNLDGRQRPASIGTNIRVEYRLNETDALTFDGYGSSYRFASSNSSFYTTFDAVRDSLGAYDQRNETNSRNASYDLDVAFRRQGKPTAPQLTVEAEYANTRTAGDVALSGSVTEADASTPVSIPTEHDHSDGWYPYLNAKLDYSHPLGATTKLETGGKFQDRRTSNEFLAEDLNSATGVYEPLATRSTAFRYIEQITGGYGLLSRRVGNFQTQAGARVETAQTTFDLPRLGERFDTRYNSIYPSAAVTYNLTATRILRASYSRRVSRPNPYQLNPAEYRQDLRNVSRGNSALGAEYTDVFDLSFTEAHVWGTLQLNPYIRRTNDAVRSIQFVDTNGVSVSTYANVAHNQSVGADLNLNYRHGAFTGTLGGGPTYYTSDATNISITTANLSTTAFSWTVRGNGTWTFSKLLSTQGFAFYRPPT